jgi:Ni,Fe-hydrogenase III large subunit
MLSLLDLIAAGAGVNSRPWPRAVVDIAAWVYAIGQLADGRWSLSAFWGDAGAVHLALRDETSGTVAALTLLCPDRTFPSVGLRHPPARRLERAISDLWGLAATDTPDPRPWLDHGKWNSAPFAADAESSERRTDYPFLPVDGDNLHEVAVGPIHAGIIEPGHFRFTASGETVVRLEERLGYAHKGIEAHMAGAEVNTALALAERTSGDCTVAYTLAFSRSVEAALEIAPPRRAEWLRALALELERIANHLGDFGAVCNDAAFTLIHAHCAMLREDILRTAESLFGSRLMRGLIAPGGVCVDPSPHALDGLARLADTIERRLGLLTETFEETSSLQDRTVGTGRVSLALVRQFAAGGFVGRASGRPFDARKAYPFPPYDTLTFDPPALVAGDVDARVRIRILEIQQSLGLIRQIVRTLPPEAHYTHHTTFDRAGEGASIVEGFRGDILVWLRIDDRGRIERCHLRDPSWFQWPLLEAAIEGNIIADFPLCNKSFNCSYSGHDL